MLNNKVLNVMKECDFNVVKRKEVLNVIKNDVFSSQKIMRELYSDAVRIINNENIYSILLGESNIEALEYIKDKYKLENISGLKLDAYAIVVLSIMGMCNDEA